MFFAVGLNYALGTLTEAATLLSVLASALLFQANVDTFLLSMNAAAGPLPKRSGLGTLDSVNELASAVKVASTLNEIRELLRTQSLGGGGGGEGGGVGEPLSARQTYLNLAGVCCTPKKGCWRMLSLRTLLLTRHIQRRAADGGQQRERQAVRRV